ncbi:Galactinol synthase 1-like protein [Cladobotryum mycophilum]|uniref:Galactinol synthase 1-like protein n=1 Tax=Cladobotryum mycophilum TaxID=491253 RepID=A0ABR0SK93_9HYPO
MAFDQRAADSDKIWASLITNLNYLPGLLTLHHSLQTVKTEFPFVALYTESFPESGRKALAARNIPSQLVPHLQPSSSRDYSKSDPRFNDTWTKLVVFSLTGYSRVVLLDSDMLLRDNMDELMGVYLDTPEKAASDPKSPRVLAASHACVCNPLKKPHYPAEWIPSNCAFTSQHEDPEDARITGANPEHLPYNGGLNSGLLIVQPSVPLYGQIIDYMEAHASEFVFPDQDLLSNLFHKRWLALPYTVNALKTLRWKGVHHTIWRDDWIRNIHYILSPKPWDEINENGEWTGTEETHKWWIDANNERKAGEKAKGIEDGF